MPDKKGRLSPMEQEFIKHMANTGDATYAATQAGYSSPAKRGSQNANNEQVMAVVRAKTLARLQNDVLPLAVDRHLALLADKLTTGATLTRAIELAYKYGFAAGEDGRHKEPHEMTPEELASAIATLRRAAADRAKAGAVDLEETAPGRFEPAADPGVFA